jgi:hypothetical protein
MVSDGDAAARVSMIIEPFGIRSCSARALCSDHHDMGEYRMRQPMDAKKIPLIVVSVVFLSSVVFYAYRFIALRA